MRASGDANCETEPNRKQRSTNDLEIDGRYEFGSQRSEQQDKQDFGSNRHHRAEGRDGRQSANDERYSH